MQDDRIPAPGGGFFEGPGGMAPAFAPGGPLDPESPVLTEEYFSAFQPGFVGSGAPGDPELNMGYPEVQPTTATPGFYPTSLAAIGGAGAASSAQVSQPMSNPGLPGHGTTPGRFQPGGGVSNLPQPGQLPTQRPGRQDPGFLARIVPVSGDVSRIIPMPGPGGEPPSVGGGPAPQPPQPGQPLPPTLPGQPPSVGGGPIYPPSVGGGPIIPPSEGGGPSQGKPKGLKTLPPPSGATPPSGPPKPPGQWVTLDAGRGQPPAWAFIEATGPGTDDGLEGPAPKPTGGTSKPPLGGTPTPPMAGGGEKGHYVPVAMPQVSEWMVERQDADDVVWAWVPTIDDSYGVKQPEPPPTPQPK